MSGCFSFSPIYGMPFCMDEVSTPPVFQNQKETPLRDPLAATVQIAQEFLVSIDNMPASECVSKKRSELVVQIVSSLLMEGVKLRFFEPVIKYLVDARDARTLARTGVDMIALLFFANEWYPRPLSSIFDAEFFIQILSRMPLDKIYDLADQIETLWTPTEEEQTEIAPFYRHRKMYDGDTPQLIKEFSQFALLCLHEKSGTPLSSTLHPEFYRKIAHGVLTKGRRYVDRDSERALMVPIAFESMLGLSACTLPAYVVETILFWLWRAYEIVERDDEHSFWIQRCILFHKRLMQHWLCAANELV